MLADDLLGDFIKESREIIREMGIILENVENKKTPGRSLEKYGQLVDRIMGGALSLAHNMAGPSETVSKVADYAAVCKAVGYKAAQIVNNESFLTICVALLMDVTDVMGEFLDLLEGRQNFEIKEVVSKTMIERLRWVSNQFAKDVRDTIDAKKESAKMTQTDIDALMAKLGL